MSMADSSHFDRLSALDAAMVFLETDSVMMHVGMLALFEAGPLRSTSGEIDVDRMKTHASGVLDDLPRHRQKLAFTPIEGHPIWVDDPHFDPAHHLSFHRLAEPGDETALRELVGRILGTRLDVHRPPWELHFILGLERDRFAVVAKMHHCMVDGMAALQVFAAFFSPDPTTPLRRPTPSAPRPMPSSLVLLRAESARRFASVRGLLQTLVRPHAKRGRRIGPAGLRLGGLVEAVRSKTTLAAPTPINPGVLGHRRAYAFTAVELATMKRIKESLGGTVNDAVLATVAGAVRRHFEKHGFPLHSTEVHVVMPFDARAVAGGGEGLGNRVVPTLVRLPVELDTPSARFRALASSTRHLKSSGQVEGVAFLEDLANLAIVKPIAALVKAATRYWAGHFIVTNLPGPKQPAYFLGARMLACYPVVPIMANQALGVALLSYADVLHFGLLGDPEALPDLDFFVRCIDDEIHALLAAT